MARYLTLLRGIDIGGNSLIRMSELREALEFDGFGDFVGTPVYKQLTVRSLDDVDKLLSLCV